MVLPPGGIKFTLACRFWSSLFTREIYAKKETFGISSPSTLEEDHEARQESRHVMDMTPNCLCRRCLSINCLCLRRPPHPSIHSSKSRRDEGEAPGGSRRPPRDLELLRRWLRPCPSCHGWPYVVKPWWSSGAAT
jgi:hypothetical protein